MSIDESELDRRLEALTREVDADEALWPGIERRLRPTRRWPAISAAVAAVVFGVLLGSLALFDRETSDGPRFVQDGTEAMRSAAVESFAVSRAEASGPLEKAWQDNQAAIEQLEQALQDDPDNPLLLEFLSEARLRQARLIQRGLFPPERSI